MKEIIVDPAILLGAFFTIFGITASYLYMRMDANLDALRKEILVIEKHIGALQNADVSCTRDQEVLKKDMSSVRDAMLRMITHPSRRKHKK